MEEKLKMLAIQLKETGTDFAAVRNCLDEIIGVANYCVEYSDPQIVKILSSNAESAFLTITGQ